MESTEEYEIEKIIDHQIVGDGKYVYKVKWKGYPIEESTWEPPEHFNDTSILKAYHDQLKKRRQSLHDYSSTNTISNSEHQRKKRIENILYNSDDKSNYKCIALPIHDAQSLSVSDSSNDVDCECFDVVINGKKMRYPFRTLELEKILQVRMTKLGDLACEMKFKTFDKPVFLPIRVAHNNYASQLIRFYESLYIWKSDSKIETKKS